MSIIVFRYNWSNYDRTTTEGASTLDINVNISGSDGATGPAPSDNLDTQPTDDNTARQSVQRPPSKTSFDSIQDSSGRRRHCRFNQSVNQWFYFGNKPISEIDNKTGETEITTKTTKTVKNITHTLHTQMQIRKSA